MENFCIGDMKNKIVNPALEMSQIGDMREKVLEPSMGMSYIGDKG